jgi:DNA-binding transcriptional regulator YiaG
MENELDVKSIREMLGLTQAGLAVEMGVDQSTISNWETRQTSPRGPARRVLMQLAKAKKSKARVSA